MAAEGPDRVRREFEETALIHMQSIYTAALRLTRNSTEAEDLFQETFLRAFRFFHQFRRGSNCRAWLLTIMHNVFLTRLRRSAPAEVDFEEELVYREAEIARVAPHNPEADVLHRLAAEDIHRAIRALPPKLRVVVVLADLEGCSYREIAEICAIPVGTVMSRLYRGRQALRKALAAYGEEGGGSRDEP